MLKSNRHLLLFVLAILPLTTTALAQEKAGIHVTGTGTVHGEPDLASFDVGINVLNEDVNAALTEASAIAEAVITALTDAGLDDEDIRTRSLDVWREDRQPSNGGPLVSAFRVIHTLRVTVWEVARTGDLLGLAMASGANQVSNVNYTFAEPAQLRAQARELAMQSARTTADQLAALAGATLGAPTFIEEHAVSDATNDQRALAYSMDSAASVPVTPGELAVTVRLTVHFSMSQVR